MRMVGVRATAGKVIRRDFRRSVGVVSCQPENSQVRGLPADRGAHITKARVLWLRMRCVGL